jgi:hypothetical protein
VRVGRAVLGLVALAGLGLACGGDPAPAGVGRTQPPPGVGQAVRDGAFEFRVGLVQCGRPVVGDAPTLEAADGQFCLVELTVENATAEPRMFTDADQKAFNLAGMSYTTDPSAANYINEEDLPMDIAPGQRVTVTIVFDIPKDEKLTGLELHDSPFSAGVRVNLAP